MVLEQVPCQRANKAHKVRRANKFETPGLETDIHGNIAAAKLPLVSLIGGTPKL
jgi:hypothetical protein